MELDINYLKDVNHLTKDTIDKTPDEDLELLILAYVANYAEKKVKDKRSAKEKYKVFKKLSKALQMAYATQILELEVHNGGFSQFFWNSSGIFAIDALEGYETLGLAEHAGIVESAIEILLQGKEIWRGKATVGTLEAYSKFAEEVDFGDLDHKFIKLDIPENIASKARVRYIRENWKDFVTE